MPEQNLPAEIVVTELPDGVRIDLPERKPGCFRAVGVLALVVGLAVAGGGIAGVVSGLVSLIKNPGIAAFFTLILHALFSIPLFMAGATAGGAGLLLLKSRARIELTGRRLRDIERVGPFHWTFNRATPTIQKLEVRAGVMQVDGQPIASGPLAEIVAILVHCPDEPRPMMLAAGYPLAMLQPVADDLARRIDRLSADASRPPVEVAVNTQPFDLANLNASQPDLPVPQPPDSKTIVDRNPEGLTLTVPPAGLIKGSKGLFFFSLLWLAFITFFTAGMIKAGAPWFVFLFLTIFWAIGIGMLLGAINMGKRSAIVDVVGPMLVVTQAGLFKTRQQEWNAQDIDDVRRGPSGMTVNDRPVLCLQVKLKSGKPRNLLTGRDEDELTWLAYEIRTALKLPMT